MTDAMTSEVNPGPPRVIAQMRSKDRRPPINARMITVVVAGLDSGRMTRQNRWTAEAPSVAAASKYSRGIETIPAMKITVASPTPFQTSTRATDSSAYLGSTSQAGPWMPIAASDFVDEAVGRVHEDGEGEADADGAHQDREEDHRAQEPPGDDLRAEQLGQQDPQDHLEPAGDDRVHERVLQADDQRRLLEEVDEVVQADELVVGEVPAGQAEEERRECRHDEEHEEDDRGRQAEPKGVGALLPGRRRRRRHGRRDGAAGVHLGRHCGYDQPLSPSCWACFLTSWS